MTEHMSQLRQELRQAGASAAEVDVLVRIASQLDQLRQSHTTAASVSSKRFVRVFKPLAFTAAGLVVGMLLVAVAQTVSPTSFLYRVQQLSDKAAISIHPSYRATVMMKRAQQVNELVAGRASSNRVLATLADYTAEASAYKSTPHANYAAFEFCKAALEQAATSSPSAVKQAITISLQTLDTT